MKKITTNSYAIGFIVYCLIAGSLLFQINQSSSEINTRIDQLITDFQIKRNSIAVMSEATKIRILLLVQMIGTEDIFDREEMLDRFYEQGSRYLNAREEILSITLNESENTEMIRIWDSVVVTAPILREVSDLLIIEGGEAEASLLLQEVLPTQQNITKSFENLLAAMSEQVAKRQRLLQAKLVTHQQLIFILFGVSVVLAFITLLIMQRNQILLASASENAIKQQHKAEEANQEKSRFLANMSHELRTPMHAILNFTVLALKRSEDAKQEKFLQNIRTSGLRLTSLLDDLLDLSKLEASKMDANFVYQDLTTLIDSAISEISSLASNKAILIDLDNRRHFECMFDQKLMFQVVVNLLSNAIKFSPEQSQISISLNHVDTGGENLVQVTVSDEGLGIPADQLESVFDKFYQSTKTRTQAGGTGLGLPICKEIIALHHGKIWAESPVNGKSKGTAFTFSLPVIHATAEKITIPDIQTAINSHLEWEKMIEDMITGEARDIGNHEPLSELNHHICPLGQWIDSVNIDSTVFLQLKRKHDDFHQLAGELVAYHMSGQDYAKSEKLVEFQQASDRIIFLLKSLKLHAESDHLAA